MTEVTRTLMQVLTDMMRVMGIYIILILLTLFMMSNWVLPYFSVLKPQIILIIIFYWTLYRPGMMPYWVIFLAGLLLDIANPILPLGTHAFSYLLIAGILRPRRRMLMGQPFVMVWITFIGTMIIDMILKMIILAFASSVSLNQMTIGINGLATILFFPLGLLMLVGLHRLLPPSRGMISS